jgi:hypothetical protein
MAKKTKTQEKSGLPSLAQLKKEVANNYLHTERFLIKLGPEAFNDTMSSPVGFGAQDLKQPYFNLYIYLLGKYQSKLVVKLDGYKSVSIHAKV